MNSSEMTTGMTRGNLVFELRSPEIHLKIFVAYILCYIVEEHSTEPNSRPDCRENSLVHSNHSYQKHVAVTKVIFFD